MKKISKKKIVKIGILVIIILVLVLLFFSCNRQSQTLYQEEEAAVRDIITYHNFSGNVEVDTSRNVIAMASQQVVELLVEEGDTVKTGDTIAILDSDSLKQTIEMKESALSTTELSNYYNKRDAQKSYEDYKNNLDAGLNTQINSAKSGMDQAYSAALTAQRAYDEAKAAYAQTEPYASTKAAYDTAKTNYEAVKSQYDAADETGRAALEAALNEAKTAYDAAGVSMDAMEEARELALRDLSDGVLKAITSYDSAKSSYDAAVTSANQALESYENAVSKVNDLSSTETSQMELDSLYDQLEDYTIKANMDGVISMLSIKEGSMVASGTVVAEISDFSKMKIEIKIDEYDILGVEEGKNVEIYIDAIEKNYNGTISKISKKAATVGGVSYFTAEVEFDADDDVRSGMTVEVKLISKEAYGVTSISMEALRYEKDNTAYVLVKNAEGKEEKKTVTVGITDGNYVEIKEGLSEGDIILVTPQMNYMNMMMEMQ